MTDNLPVGLYIHYPWCVRKCPYCDFNSYPGKNISSAQKRAYVDALIEDFRSFEPYLGSKKLLSVYFGGGTPSLLGADLALDIIEAIRSNIDDKTEISMECNPGTVDFALLKDYHDIGVNRLSVGVQSFDDALLKRLGRIHNANQAITCCEDVLKAGFDNFNIDIMHGLPGQDEKLALSDLKTATSLGCNHLSWYELTLEEDTAFGRNPPKLPSEDVLADIERSGFEYLKEQGFKRYEVSGFTRDRRCLHNQNYWYFGDYIGIGAGAHSKLKRGMVTRRRENRALPDDYILQVKNAHDDFFEVKASDLPFEFMLNRLRIFDDVRLDEFEETTGLPFSVVEPKLREAQRLLLLDFTSTHYHLTEKGRWMLNEILEMFL